MEGDMNREQKVVCFGAGLIGSGWATQYGLKGLQTVLLDISEAKLNASREMIMSNLDLFVREQIITKEESEWILDKLIFTMDFEKALRGATFIQENGPENEEIKRSIVEQIEQYAPDEAIISSSTSGLLISKIASNAKHPERIIGAHPYNPVHLIPLVEIVKGPQTSDAVLEQAVAFYRSVDKEPVVLNKELPGFISNRLALALYREAVDIVENGICSFEDIDNACLYGPGLRYGLLGPNMIYHLGGGAHGIKGILSHIGSTVEVWWEDMAKWTEWPEGYAERVQAGVEQAMENRDLIHGTSVKEVGEFRDRGLITLLKHHGKL